MLDELRAWAQRARNQADSKAKAILDWLTANLKPDGQWNDRRVILFTEYRTTHQWIHQILASHGFGGERLAQLHGGLSQEEREPIKAAFQASPQDSPVRILLATDAASEGIDLQNHCNRLIHLEIPYNPNVMEQRNGRIDRHGQREKEVLIWHPVDGGDAGGASVGGHGEDILRALRKLDSMRADMGSVNPVIAPQMSGLIEGSLKDLDIRAFQKLVDDDEKEKVLQKYLFDHLWLLDPSWERATGTEVMETRLLDSGIVVEDLTKKEELGRVDIKYRLMAGKHIVVELKKAGRNMKLLELQEQGQTYVDKLKKILLAQNEPTPNIEVVFVIGKPIEEEASNPDRLKSSMAAISPGSRIVHYDTLIRGAQEAYSAYIDKSKELDKLENIVNKI